MKVKNKNITKSGQTLVEVMVAVALLAATVVSTTALARQLLRSNIDAGQQTQAATLGTQQFELLRAYRDDLIAEGRTAWDTHIMPSNSCRTFYMETDGSGRPVLRTTGSPEPFSNDTNSYLHLYRRIIEMCPSREFNMNTGTYTATRDLVTVEVRVMWDDPRGLENNNVYRSYLANWSREPVITSPSP